MWRHVKHFEYDHGPYDCNYFLIHTMFCLNSNLIFIKGGIECQSPILLYYNSLQTQFGGGGGCCYMNHHVHPSVCFVQSKKTVADFKDIF